jgi:hypothetical protein
LSISLDRAGFCAAEAGDLLTAFGAEAGSHIVAIGTAFDRSCRSEGPTVYKSVDNAAQNLFAAAFILKRLGSGRAMPPAEPFPLLAAAGLRRCLSRWR